MDAKACLRIVISRRDQNWGSSALRSEVSGATRTNVRWHCFQINNELHIPPGE